MLVLGIDPGSSGALAFYDPASGDLRIEDMPSVSVKRGSGSKSEPAPSVLCSILSIEAPDMVWLEKVGARPGEAAGASFSFGRSVGVIEGVIAAMAYPLSHVAPADWQRYTRCRAGKEGNCLRACELFPRHSALFRGPRGGWLDGRADAALIAWYGSRHS